MKFEINIAGFPIISELEKSAEKAAPFILHYFNHFINSANGDKANLVIKTIDQPVTNLEFVGIDDKLIVEQSLSSKDIIPWLEQIPGSLDGFPLDEGIITSYCLGGLLFFDPDSCTGRILLLRQDADIYFRPLYRIIWMYLAQFLGEKERCFIHGAAIEKDNQGYLFLGDSGAGKSTLARNAIECRVLSDDSPVFVKDNGEYFLYPSPYRQLPSEKMAQIDEFKKGVSLKAFYFIEKDSDIKIEEVEYREALSLILNRSIHFFSYMSNRAKTAFFELFMNACRNIPSYRLYLDKGTDPMPYIQEINNGEQKNSTTI